MAQPKTVEQHIKVHVDLTAARRAIKRTLKLAQEANVELARLESRVDELQTELAEFGITLEVEDIS